MGVKYIFLLGVISSKSPELEVQRCKSEETMQQRLEPGSPGLKAEQDMKRGALGECCKYHFGIFPKLIQKTFLPLFYLLLNNS
jgi:hypothetical protein